MKTNKIKEIALDYLMSTPIGEEIEKTLNLFGKVQEIIYSLYITKDESKLNLIKIGTVLTFAILKKIATGANIHNFSKEDLKEIADTVIDGAIVGENENFTKSVFLLYSQYINYSVDCLETISIDKNAQNIRQLAIDLDSLTNRFDNGEIKETSYIEDCLWICTEAMFKLLSVWVTSFIPAIMSENKEDSNDKKLSAEDIQTIKDLINILPSYTLGCARLSMYKKEQEILTRYIESQHALDRNLEEQKKQYEEELNRLVEQFSSLLEDPFTIDNSVKLALNIGLSENEILKSEKEIDDFFLS